MARDLDVFLHGHGVGRLRQEDSGRLSFRYGDAWLQSNIAAALSLSLPLREQPFDDRETRPFFAGLLPDDLARERLARHLGVSRKNDFALLAEVGGECAGAVALYPPDQRPPAAGGGELLPLDEARLASYLRDLPQRPLLAGGELRLSLAGAQDKMALVRRDGRFFMPRGDLPTTHIIKPAIEAFADTVVNEFFCLELAARAGLEVPPVEIGEAEEVDYLLIERYDREQHAGQTRRLHQEDFCQALGIAPEQKYQAEGGPSLAQCFELLGATDRPAVARLELLRRVLFNFLIGNADAHGKNFALVHRAGSTRLAPAYDVLSTIVYPEHSDRMAMKIGGKNRFKTVYERHWRRFADEAGLSWPRVRQDLAEMATTIPGLAHELARQLERQDSQTTVGKIVGFIERQAADLA